MYFELVGMFIVTIILFAHSILSLIVQARTVLEHFTGDKRQKIVKEDNIRLTTE